MIIQVTRLIVRSLVWVILLKIRLHHVHISTQVLNILYHDLKVLFVISHYFSLYFISCYVEHFCVSLYHRKVFMMSTICFFFWRLSYFVYPTRGWNPQSTIILPAINEIFSLHAFYAEFLKNFYKNVNGTIDPKFHIKNTEKIGCKMFIRQHQKILYSLPLPTTKHWVCHKKKSYLVIVSEVL